VCFPEVLLGEEGSTNHPLRRTKLWRTALALPPWAPGGGSGARVPVDAAGHDEGMEAPPVPPGSSAGRGALRFSLEVQSSAGPGSAGPGPRGAPPTGGGTNHG
jgi:hypothetical protein